MGRDELSDSGPAGRPAPRRPSGATRYSDRFRPAAVDVGADRRGESDLVGEDDGSGLEAGAGPGNARRSWPPWLTRGAAGIGVLAAAAVGVASADRDVETPKAAAEPRNARMPLHDAPPVASLDVGDIEAELWESNGFSYEITLINTADTAYDLVDVGPAMSGTELAWDRSLVLAAGATTTVRVDFLVLNCLAATTSAAPTELRMVVRGQAADAVAALAEVTTVEQGRLIDAAGEAICASGGGDGGIVLG